MANIYSQQGITETPVARIGEMSTASEARQSAKIFDAIQDNFERKAKEHQALAEKLYENGSNIAITQGLNELSRNPKYASNPEAFALEADKMAEKIYAQIDDPTMKTEVAMNYELKKNPYINRAYAHMYKQQNDQLEYQALSGIQDNMDSLGISIENVMSGVMGVDDLRTLSESKNQFDRYINQKDAQGFDLFTPMQKALLERQYNQNVINRLKGGFTQLPIQERQKIAETLKEDMFNVNFTNEEGITGGYDIKNMIPTKSYLDFKDFVLKTNARATKIAGGKGGVTKEIQALADTQQITNDENQRAWKELVKVDDKKDKANGILAYRQKLQDQVYQNQLSESDFVKSMDATIPEMESLLQEDTSAVEGSFFSRNTAMQGAAERVRGELKFLQPRQKMFILDTIYNQLAQNGLVEKSYSGDLKTTTQINDIADNAIKTWLENQIPGLPDTQADKVLRRGHFFNYIKNPNPIYTTKPYDNARSLFVRDGIKYYDFTAPNGITYSKRIIDG